MGWDDSFLGFDFNCDGKINSSDDIMFMMFMDEEEKRRKKEHQYDEYSEFDEEQ